MSSHPAHLTLFRWIVEILLESEAFLEELSDIASRSTTYPRYYSGWAHYREYHWKLGIIDIDVFSPSELKFYRCIYGANTSAKDVYKIMISDECTTKGTWNFYFNGFYGGKDADDFLQQLALRWQLSPQQLDLTKVKFDLLLWERGHLPEEALSGFLKEY